MTVSLNTNRRRAVSVMLTGLLLVLLGCRGLIGQQVREPSEQTLVWGDVGKGWGPWGTSGDFIYAASVVPTVLEAWQWDGATMKKRCSVPSVDDEMVLSVAILPGDMWLSDVYGEEKQAYFCLGDLKVGREIERWKQPDDLYTELGRGSRNGKFVAAWCKPDDRTRGPRNERRIGLIAADGRSFDWVAVLNVPPDFHPSLRDLRPVPSEDGRYIGVARWAGSVVMVDVAKKTAIWTVSPGKLSADDLAFTPDGDLIYTGGTLGCVYGLKVQDGQTVSTWWATPTGKEEYGHRITTISVSPDGRFVAAGTGPEGDVYLFSTKDGQRRILNHGGSTILMTSFSPDSKRLASYAAGHIKIWKLPE